MKTWTAAAVCAIVVLLVLECADADKIRKFKKFGRRHYHKHSTTQSPVVVEELKEEPPEPQTDLIAEEINQENPETDTIRDNNVPLVEDPCLHKHCGAGRVCRLNDEGEAMCVCIPTCPEEREPRRKVCTNHNETWGSDCEVYQMRCFCEDGSEKCDDPQVKKHLHIEYYGECRDIPECTEEEMSDFPRRMRDWLYNIMRDLADRQELTPHYFKMEREAETNLTRRWTNAAVWKWCDLDGHPHDRTVSRHELFPIRAPLVALEHCIAPFLDSCDYNDDHTITLKEWAKCLELDEEDFEDRCEEVKGDD